MTIDVEVVVVRRGDPARDSISPVTIHGLHAWSLLQEHVAALGMRLRVAAPSDVDRGRLRRSVLLLDFGSIANPPRVLYEAAATIAWSLESPLVAHRGFHRLDRIAGSSDITATFAGARDLVPASVDFRPIHYPIAPRPIVEKGWAERDLIAMIASPKRVRPSLSDVQPARPYRSARVLAANTLARTYGLRGSWVVPDLYEQRLSAIAAFADDAGFKLYGRGWERTRWLRSVPGRVFGGPVQDKVSTLSDYRFSLCFENTRFPGYVTEKIFDCFFAGTIPVYLGAPDIDSYVPRDSFIDVTSFGSLADVREYLRGLTSAEAASYLDAAKRFLSSDGFTPFHEDTFVSTMAEAIRSLA